MKRALCVLLVLAATPVLAQEKNPVTSAVKEIVPRQQKNLVGAAEAMPAEKYAYKPTEKQMTFGHLILHVIESNNHLCSKISDIAEPKPAAPAKESDGKDKLVPALKASFDFCASALSKVDDSKLADEIELFGGRKGSRAFGLIALTSGWADHYGAAAIYLRLNGLLPPTAQAKQ
ncbi:MAG TPA: DinB family protein [Candidatus Sulfotelmatobacter sp.]|nr:DinB family protein [Candidatus Sulfotelmatobacter sp.]